MNTSRSKPDCDFNVLHAERSEIDGFQHHRFFRRFGNSRPARLRFSDLGWI